MKKKKKKMNTSMNLEFQIYTFTKVCAYLPQKQPYFTHLWSKWLKFSMICYHADKMTKSGIVSIHCTHRTWCIKLFVPIFVHNMSAFCMKNFVWNWCMSQNTKFKHCAWDKMKSEVLHIVILHLRGDHAKQKKCEMGSVTDYMFCLR